MPFCHSAGNIDTDGCCWVNGQVCPLRWKIVDGGVYDHQGNNLGTVDSFINSYLSSKPARDRAREQLQGARIVCRAAVEVLANDAKLLNDRPKFEAAWNAHPQYVQLVRPHWANIEQQLGLPNGSYQCSTWKGVGVPQCCFAEDASTNTTKSATLAPSAKIVRQAGGT